METNGFGSGSSQNWIPSCLSVYVSWKRAIAIESRIGQKMLKGCFFCCSLCYSTVQYRCDMFRNCCRDAMCILCTVALCL